MPFVTAADVTQLHSALDAQAQGLDAAVSEAIQAGKLDGSSRTARDWHLMTGRVAAYLDDPPSTLRAAAQMDAGQQLQRDLHPWYPRLQAAGVQVPPEPAPPPSPQDLFGNVKDLLLLAVLFVAIRELR